MSANKCIERAANPCHKTGLFSNVADLQLFMFKQEHLTICPEILNCSFRNS